MDLSSCIDALHLLKTIFFLVVLLLRQPWVINKDILFKLSSPKDYTLPNQIKKYLCACEININSNKTHKKATLSSF